MCCRKCELKSNLDEDVEQYLPIEWRCWCELPAVKSAQFSERLRIRTQQYLG